MKTIKFLSAVFAVAFLIGCVSASKTVYNTLASVQVTTSGAYSAYLDLVVQGKLTTNSVPLISKDYTIYQGVWNTAVSVAALGVNAPATTPVTDAASKVIADITIAKGTP
jgi:hypothetical protein